MANLKPVILCVNHRDHACGVHQFFKRLTAPLIQSIKLDVYYIDPAEEHEFEYWVQQLNPDIVLYNFYTAATMPWLTPQKVSAWKSRFKQACLFHEVPLTHMAFDLIFHQDPCDTMTAYHKLARPIPTYIPNTLVTYIPNSIPVIGSFGFGLGGKGFGRIAALASQEFPKAHLRFNIPYAHFGDIDGHGAKDWARHILACVTNPNITTEITHEFMNEQQLLDWLACNDLNAFLYDENYGRGISGTLDYALSVHKPIAITKSWQFKHIWQYDDSFLVENNKMSDIITRGITHLEKFHAMWNDSTVLDSFEAGFREVLHFD